MALEPCASGDISAVQTVPELAAFSIDQEAALLACEAKRQALVSVIQGSGVK